VLTLSCPDRRLGALFELVHLPALAFLRQMQLDGDGLNTWNIKAQLVELAPVLKPVGTKLLQIASNLWLVFSNSLAASIGGANC
jgi:hypothetical protein